MATIWKYADKHTQPHSHTSTHIHTHSHTKKVRPQRAQRCFDFTLLPSSSLSHFALTQLLMHSVAPVTTLLQHTHTGLLCPFLYVTNWQMNEFITLVASTGRPDLAALIMGSRPLAFLRCCAAPVMSYKTTQRQQTNQTTAKKHLFKLSMKQQAAAVKTSPLRLSTGSVKKKILRKKKIHHTFICLERRAARKKPCLLSNRKSTCCWATRIFKRKGVKAVTLFAHSVCLGRYECTNPHNTHLYVPVSQLWSLQGAGEQET